jgi:hypothetical protein
MSAAQATSTGATVSEFVLVSEPSLGVDPIGLEKGRWTIGSSDENRIVASEPGIADRHCLLLVTGQQILMKSWSEQTRVNGDPQREACLSAGDVLTLGNTDFQIRCADSIPDPKEGGQPGSSTVGQSSIVGQIEVLSQIVEELDHELAGRRTEVGRLDEMIDRIQTGLEKDATSVDRIARLRSQIVELQQTAITVEQNENDNHEGVQLKADRTENDMRLQAAQQNLDQIIDGLDEEDLALGDPGYERQLSLRVQQQLRQLESVSASLHGRAAVLEQQAIELDGQRLRHGEWQSVGQHDSEEERGSDEERDSSQNEYSESYRDIESLAGSPDLEFRGYSTEEPETPGEFNSFEDPVAETAVPQLETDEVETSADQGATDDVPATESSTSEFTDEEELEDDPMHSYVNEQRARLRELMDDFEPLQATGADEAEDASADEAELAFEESLTAETDLQVETDQAEEENAEIREAVTAAVLGGASPLSEVAGARRSRDEAIRQLDELIRDANDESLCDVPVPKLTDCPASREAEDSASSYGTDRTVGRDTVTDGEAAWDEARVNSVDVDLENESVDNEDEDSYATSDSIEATLDFATEQLEAVSEIEEASVENESPNEGGFGIVEDFQTGETGTDVESSLTTEDAVDEESSTEFPPSFDWSAGKFGETDETQLSKQGSRSEFGDSSFTPEMSAEAPDSWSSTGESETSGPDTVDQAEEARGGEETSTSDSEVPEDVATADSDEPEARVDELRSQLAQMFDLPKGTSATSDSSGTTGDEADLEAISSHFPSIEELPDDGVTLESEVETASTHAVEETANASEPADPSSEPDSIADYMEALLARNRRQTGDERPPEEPIPAPAAPPEPAPETGLVSERFLTQPMTSEDSEEGDSLDRSWLTEGPKHKQDRDAVRASLTTLREVANHSARSAVAQASKAQLKQEILTLTGASLICLAFAVAAAMFKVNPLLPLGAVGLSLYFAVKLGNEMRHSWAIMRHAKNATNDGPSNARIPADVIDQDE